MGKKLPKINSKKAKERQNQIGPTSTTERDILVAKRDVLEQEKITGFNEQLQYALDFSNPLKKGSYFFNREKNEEIAELNRILTKLDENNKKLNEQLEKGITATTNYNHSQNTIENNVNKSNV
jgi:hypothetical protein